MFLHTHDYVTAVLDERLATARRQRMARELRTANKAKRPAAHSSAAVHHGSRGRSLGTIFSLLALGRRSRRDSRELRRVLGTAPPSLRHELILMAQRDNVSFVR